MTCHGENLRIVLVPGSAVSRRDVKLVDKFGWSRFVGRVLQDRPGMLHHRAAHGQGEEMAPTSQHVRVVGLKIDERADDRTKTPTAMPGSAIVRESNPNGLVLFVR